MRNPTFDIAKFLVMIGVIAGHLVGNGLVVKAQIFQPQLSNAIIGVSMPFFFMVSGYFSAKSLEGSDWAKHIARIVGFMWPLFAFGLVFASILYFTGSRSLLGAALHPFGRVIGGSWFLRTMAIVYLLAAIVFRTGRRRVQIVSAILMYIALVFSPKEGAFAWSASVMHMYPYFMFGALVLKSYELYAHHLIAVLSGLVFCVVVFFEGNCRTNGMAFYWVSADWHDMLLSLHGFVCFVGRTVVGITGSIFLLWLIDRIILLIPKVGWLGQFGTTTLGVYVMHEWPMAQLSKAGLMQGFSSLVQWPLALLLFFVFHYLTLGIRAVPRLKFFFFGDEKWLAEKLRQNKFFGKILA